MAIPIEELEFPEVAALVDRKVGPSQLVVDHRPRIGRKPRKCRQVVDRKLEEWSSLMAERAQLGALSLLEITINY
ncbi:unnamed protein product [Linum trigynum]|uniref:Uncharacterized protein n=1 Tax=Linum trigynum TaxID=586398 RepID=A0AAV2FTQ0_9ROSI